MGSASWSFEHGQGPGEVGGQQPFALGGGERRAQLDRAAAGPPRTGPGGSIARRCEVRMRISSMSRGHASWACWRRSGASPSVAGHREGGGEARPATSAGHRTAEQQRAPPAAPTTNERGDHRAELARAHVAQPGLGQPLAAPRPGRAPPAADAGWTAPAGGRRRRSRGPGPIPRQPNGERGVAQDHAVAGGDGQPQGDQNGRHARSSARPAGRPGRSRPRRRRGPGATGCCPSSSARRRALPRLNRSVVVNCVASGPAGQVLHRQ